MKTAAAALCLVALSSSAHAQPAFPSSRSPSSGGATKAQYLPDATLETLLNSGYEIRAASGPLVFLTRPVSGKPNATIACTFSLNQGMMIEPASAKIVRSACFALN